MISFPHAKVNLGLSIVSKRPDGFHNLETVFYPLPLRDVLEIIPAKESKFVVTGLPVPGENQNNLVLKAYDLIKRRYPETGFLEIYLHKAIPMGAGLGGGSSDAAGIIRMLNHLFKLQIAEEKVMEIALEMGSDCSFFMQEFPCFASGRGEILQPLSTDLSAYSFLLIHPEIKVETAWAFSKIKPALPKYDLRESISKPIQNWKAEIINDFEIPVFESLPQLKEIKNKLYGAGALYASMTGSGSTIFGIFEKGFLPEMPVEHASRTWIA